jgi:hypothetical protein
MDTSDWHIGRALYGRKRYEEYEAFLNWLAGFVEDEKIDVLLVAGDVFDNSTPSNRAQEIYYRFLCRVASTSDRHVRVDSLFLTKMRLKQLWRLLPDCSRMASSSALSRTSLRSRSA